jgi:hypothetical protein
VSLTIPPVPAVTPVPLETLSDRLAYPQMAPALRDLADRMGVCRHPQVLRSVNEVTGQADFACVPCGATLDRKCPSCARAGQRLRREQAMAGWHLAEEPAPEPQANPEQVALLTTRGLYEQLRWECESRGEWEQVADLDDAIDECEKLMRVSGLRGTIAPHNRNYQTLPALNEAGDPAGGEESSSGGDPAGVSTPATMGIGPDTITACVPDGDRNDQAASDGSEPGGGAPGSRGRRTRSTRRRQDTPDLPRLAVDARTVGRTYTTAEGKVFRPSTFVTLTLPSYGRVKPDGSPVNPDSYDYRRAAWDAVHFPALLDRFFQNLRRAVGWNVQYFGAVEAQRRLSPHAHFAIRGAIPKATIREVIAATYRQVWWPATATVVYPDHEPRPEWDAQTGTYRDPTTGRALATWDEALDELDEALDADPDRGPEHVVGFGEQYDIQGVLGGTPKADKLIGYVCKYLTKGVGDTHQASTGPAAEHHRRLWQEMRYTPCSPRCANWLRYGIQPQGAKDGLRPGFCRGKVHQPHTLGLGGRRVLVSRLWSGKTLADHKADRNAWMRNLMQVARHHDQPTDPEHEETIRQARDKLAPEPLTWDWVKPGSPGVPDRNKILLRYIAIKTRQREQINEAKTRLSADHGPGDAAVSVGVGG